MARSTDHSGACKCGRRLRLRHAELEGETVEWEFGLDEGGALTFLHATTAADGGDVRDLWHLSLIHI